MNSALKAIFNLDFPVMAAGRGGRVLGTSPAADVLFSHPQGLTGIALPELLDIPPTELRAWLAQARSGTHARLRLPGGTRTPQLLIRASPVTGPGRKEPVWLLALHSRDSVSRQREEREILLRIGSVPISELMGETVGLTAEAPEASPITGDMLEQITRYIGAGAALVFREKGLPRLSLIGHVGLDAAVLADVLEYLDDDAHVAALRRGAVGGGADSGLVYSFSDLGRRQPGLRGLLRRMPRKPEEIWVDGVGGFGAVVTLFHDAPDAELRPFATEANVRLGRHLESAGYSRDLYSAYQELQSAQERIIQAGRLAALGEIAAGIAHELRQPVTAINNFVSNIFSQVETKRFERLSEKLGEYRDRSRRNVERLMGIIDHLRSFARDDRVAFRPVNVHAMMSEIRDTFFHDDRTLRRKIPVEWRLAPDLPTVEMDAQRIEQVILNLVSNAGDALDGHPDPKIVVGVDAEEDKVCIYVKDNGPGIPEDLQKRVFDPFFTTKPAGQGTGIGLSISHGIVKGHNGDIMIESGAEGGSTLAVLLPIRQPAPVPESRERAPRTGVPPSGTEPGERSGLEIH